MTVSKTTDYWTSRLDGNDPHNPIGMNNEKFTGGAGQANGLNWTINAANDLGYYTITPTTDEYTLWISFSYTNASDIPAIGIELARLDNGTHEVQLRSNGNATSLQLIGAGGATTLIENLDLTMSEDDAIPTVIRLTLSSSGIAKAYIFDIIEDDDGNDLTKSINAYHTKAQVILVLFGVMVQGRLPGMRYMRQPWVHSIRMKW